jgi:hypothetical protein
LRLGTGAQNKDLTNVAGDLTWDGNKLATSIDLSSKQDALDYYSESLAGQTTILQGLDTSSLHIAWDGTSYTNIAGSHQVIATDGTVGVGLYNTTTNGTPGNTIYMTCELRGVGSCLECAFAVSDAITWTGAPEVVISGLNTATFTSVTWSFPLPANRQMYFVVGGLPAGSSLTYTPGTVHMRNFRLYRASGVSTISTQLNVTGDVTCTSVVQTSDRRVKENIVPASLEVLQAVFDAVEVQTYTRTDGVEGPRVGFIANDVKAVLPEDGSLDMLAPFIANDLIGVDYSRMCTVLWGAVKMLKQRVDALELA